VDCRGAQLYWRVDARISHAKNRSAEWRELWSDELVEWIEWRLEQATAESSRAGRDCALLEPETRDEIVRALPGTERKRGRST
jgi:hypothetical protein